MNKRMQRAMEMMETEDYCTQIDKDNFSVRSQSNSENRYIVSRTGNGLICKCPDHTTRNADCKHIKVVLNLLKNNQCRLENTFRIMKRSNLKLCKYCDSGRIIKYGIRKNKKGNTQRFECKDCKKKFTANFGFEKKRHDDSIITGSMEMCYSGMSVRDISRYHKRMGVKVSHVTIFKWISHYSKISSEYVDGIVPRTGNWVRADEAFIRVAGKMNYLFSTMDDDTRFWIVGEMADSKFQHQADKLLLDTIRKTGKTPRIFITDGLPTYESGARRIFGNKTYHSKNVHLRGQMNNNTMERLNGEIRDREKVFRGLKKMDTSIIPGMRVWYNYSKEHGGLGGDVTPSEAALIKVEGDNKWKTIIQNASLDAISA